MSVGKIARALGQAVGELQFEAPVDTVYNPLQYAGEIHQTYCQRYGKGPKTYLWLGMNPGPFGMGQTGIPFGEIDIVRDWMGLEGTVVAPSKVHPKRPILGFECTRSEVSGRRLWGYIRSRWETPERFFASSFVYNYCPLLFMEASGKNLTPDKLIVAQSRKLYEICDEALRKTVISLQVQTIIGVGAFAEKSARRALDGLDVSFARVLHPSPASPMANRGWAQAAERALRAQELYLE